MGREYVPIFFDWLEVTQDLTAEEKGNLIDAVVAYASGQEYEHLLIGGGRIAFRFLKGQVDRNAAISDARSRAGKKEQDTATADNAQQAATNRNKLEQTQSNENKPQQTATKFPKEEENKKEKEKENKNKGNARASADPAFDAFWAEYPNKKAKPDALKAWNKLKPDAGLAQAIMTGLNRQKGSVQWQEDGGRYIPYPATWLNGRRWEDEVRPAVSQGGIRAMPAQQYTQRDYSGADEAAMARFLQLQGVLPNE